MMIDLPDCTYCAERSRAVGEQVFATAPRGDVWLLVEYTGAWGAKVLPGSDLAQPIKDRLDGWMSETPNAKLLFIRRSSPTQPKINLFMALAREIESVLYHLHLDSYDDLLTVDLGALARGDTQFEAFRDNTPLYLVCTNGRRDVSCSKYGLPIYAELQRTAALMVWACSHIGGHRFAGNLVCLPDGVCYGHLDADDIEELVLAYRNREVIVQNLRGRSCYDAPVQAAEHYLRGAEGITDLPGLRLIEVQPNADVWTVRMEAVRTGREYVVTVRRQLSEWVSCENSGDTALKPMAQFHLVTISP
jgi:hypothetical protein